MAFLVRSRLRPATFLLLLDCLLHVTLCRSSILVTGVDTDFNRTSRTRPIRREITEFTGSGPTWDLFILSLQRFQEASFNDSLSFFQIAGIHGYPVREWDNVEGQGSGGFCMHNSVLFPLWHRPYLALYEQVLSDYAHAIALEYPIDQQEDYAAAAAVLRIPYWDWAQTFGLPHVVTVASLIVNTPQGIQNVENPLLRYQFPVDMQAKRYFPNYGEISSLPYTARHYDLSIGSNQDAASADLVARSAARLSNLYELLVSRSTWTEFSAYKVSGAMNDGVNVEGIHGEIHNAIGGIKGGTAYGHMTVTEISAFDPVFWLHHANVDRLVAIWQALHPNSFIEPALNTDGTFYQMPNTIDTEDTPLAPFYSRDGVSMWTAAGVRDTAIFGYNYPELIDWDLNAPDFSVRVRSAVNKLYNPVHRSQTNRTVRRRSQSNASIAQTMAHIYADTALELGINNMEIQWYLRLKISRTAAEIGIALYFFIGDPLFTTSSWYNAPNLISAFTPFLSVQDPAQTQQIDIPCSHTVAAAIDRGFIPNSSIEVVLPFLKTNVVAVLTAQVNLYNLRGASMVNVSIVSRDVQPRITLSDFPSYGKHREHAYILNFVL